MKPGFEWQIDGSGY